jgi:hypothetical protein
MAQPPQQTFAVPTKPPLAGPEVSNRRDAKNSGSWPGRSETGRVKRPSPAGFLIHRLPKERKCPSVAVVSYAEKRIPSKTCDKQLNSSPVGLPPLPNKFGRTDRENTPPAHRQPKLGKSLQLHRHTRSYSLRESIQPPYNNGERAIRKRWHRSVQVPSIARHIPQEVDEGDLP